MILSVKNKMNKLEAAKIIDEICEVSKDEAGAITRFPFTKSWMQAQTYLKELFEELGFETFFDGAGNLHGRIGDTSDTILTGSHVDTVQNGGKYDGLYGVVGGALAIARLYQKYGTPKTALEVIAFAEEEGTRFPFDFWGSKALTGDIDWEELSTLKDKDSITLSEALQASGFSYTKDCAKRDDIKAFVELHIEQGHVLDKNQLEIGVVTSIVGHQKYHLEIFGEANHAGTTPMAHRKDAGVSAAQIISKATELAKAYGEPLVFTAGEIEFKPSLSSVVPGYAKLSLDMRHTNGETLNRFQREVLDIIEAVTASNNTTFEFNTVFDDPPTPMDANIIEMIKKSCEKQGVSYMKIPSGAAHDSQVISRIAPVGMIFVPSKNGVSHNPKEFTKPELLEKGVDILAETLHQLAY